MIWVCFWKDYFCYFKGLFLYWENCSQIEMDMVHFSHSKSQSEILVSSTIPVLNHRSIELLSEWYLGEAWFRVHRDSSEFINASLYISQCHRSLPGTSQLCKRLFRFRFFSTILDFKLCLPLFAESQCNVNELILGFFCCMFSGLETIIIF